MQLNAIVVVLAAGCGCSCPHKGAWRETWGASLLSQRQLPAAATAAPIATLGTGDPSVAEMLASGIPDAASPIPPDAAEVEMATANEALVKMANANVTAFEAFVLEKLTLICMAPPSQLLFRMQSDLGSSAPPEDEAGPYVDQVPLHPTLQLGQKSVLRRARRPLQLAQQAHATRSLRAQKAAAASRINITAVMWVVFIMPPNETSNVSNTTNASNITCPPCPCAPTGPPPLFPGLSANETAALAGRSATMIADDLVEQARGGDTPLHGLLPLTTVRRAHQNFPAIRKNSVTIGSQSESTSAAHLSDTGRSIEATEINTGTQELVKELRVRLQAANEERAAVLAAPEVPAPDWDGFTVPASAGDGVDPFAGLTYEPPPPKQGLRGH